MAYLSTEALKNDKVNQQDIFDYENRVKKILIDELNTDSYLNLTIEEKLEKLLSVNEEGLGTNYSLLINGLPYASNIINLEDIKNL